MVQSAFPLPPSSDMQEKNAIAIFDSDESAEDPRFVLSTSI
jgi:hypothetical protein